jgi:hypothetical protein
MPAIRANVRIPHRPHYTATCRSDPSRRPDECEPSAQTRDAMGRERPGAPSHGVLLSPSITDGVPIRRSAGRRRTRRISARSRRLRQRQRNAMTEQACEFVDNRLRRCPPDRAGAVPYGQAGENALRFPHLAHRSAAAHKLHSATATSRIEFDSGKGATLQPATGLSLFFPEPVQTSGTTAGFRCWNTTSKPCRLIRSPCLAERVNDFDTSGIGI